MKAYNGTNVRFRHFEGRFGGARSRPLPRAQTNNPERPATAPITAAAPSMVLSKATRTIPPISATTPSMNPNTWPRASSFASDRSSKSCCWCRCEASVSAISKMRSAAPGRILSYFPEHTRRRDRSTEILDLRSIWVECLTGLLHRAVANNLGLPHLPCERFLGGTPASHHQCRAGCSRLIANRRSSPTALQTFATATASRSAAVSSDRSWSLQWCGTWITLAMPLRNGCIRR